MGEQKFVQTVPVMFCSNCPGHMTKMAAMPIYGKNLKNLHLLNQKADDLETWHAASGARVLQVSLAITRLVGSIDLNRVMGDARYSFCHD